MSQSSSAIILSPEDHGKIFAVAHEHAPPGVSSNNAHEINLICRYQGRPQTFQKRFNTFDPFLFMGMLNIEPIPQNHGLRMLDFQASFVSNLRGNVKQCWMKVPGRWTGVGDYDESMKIKVVEFYTGNFSAGMTHMMSLYVVVFPSYPGFNVLDNAQRI